MEGQRRVSGFHTDVSNCRRSGPTSKEGVVPYQGLAARMVAVRNDRLKAPTDDCEAVWWVFLCSLICPNFVWQQFDDIAFRSPDTVVHWTCVTTYLPYSTI